MKKNNCKSWQLTASERVHSWKFAISFSWSTLYTLSYGRGIVSEIKVIPFYRSGQRRAQRFPAGYSLFLSLLQLCLRRVSRKCRWKKEREDRGETRGKSWEEVRCCHSTSGKCIYRISSNGRTWTIRPSSFVLYISSVMFIIPHDGQLDLLLPLPVWRMRLIKSDKLIASTNCAGPI